LAQEKIAADFAHIEIYKKQEAESSRSQDDVISGLLRALQLKSHVCK
jgi:hypothetical protein